MSLYKWRHLAFLGEDWEILTWILALTAGSLWKEMLLFAGEYSVKEQRQELMTCHTLSALEQEMLDLLEPQKPVIFCSNTIKSPVRHGVYHGRLQASFSWN